MGHQDLACLVERQDWQVADQHPVYWLVGVEGPEEEAMNRVLRALTGTPGPDIIDTTRQLLEWEHIQRIAREQQQRMLCIPHLLDNKSCNEVGCPNDGLYGR